MEFQSKLENGPHDRTGNESPCPTLTSFRLFSYIDFGGKAMQVPSYLYTAQWSKGSNQNCSTYEIFPDQPLLSCSLLFLPHKSWPPCFCSSTCSVLLSQAEV